MKAATEELNMTFVVLIAIGFILGLVVIFGGQAKEWITGKFNAIKEKKVDEDTDVSFNLNESNFDEKNYVYYI